MTKKYLYIIVAVAIVLLAVVVWLFVDNRRTKNEMQEIVEQMTFEKEQLEDEYEELAIQYDGYQLGQLHNDSLVELLSQEKQRVQDLLEELRITKATNARRISELKKELATVRAVMVQYVQQIDSLDRQNKRLTTENKEVKQKYEEVATKASQLEQERDKLTEVVSRAAMMEVTNLDAVMLNSRNKKTSRVSKITKMQFSYTILKNITAEAGMKTIYLRLRRPDGEIMTKSNDTFHFENQDIEYSVKKEFEYTGEQLSDVMYWNVEEVLQTGTYNADFFIDGNLVGSFPFKVEK
ncbi:MAG: hypothetical protein IJS05_05820 [Paludibacteraceae bacterium]|nr:hypothetical protein [Paludibacteraceae bacterium]